MIGCECVAVAAMDVLLLGFLRADGAGNLTTHARGAGCVGAEQLHACVRYTGCSIRHASVDVALACDIIWLVLQCTSNRTCNDCWHLHCCTTTTVMATPLVALLMVLLATHSYNVLVHVQGVEQLR